MEWDPIEHEYLENQRMMSTPYEKYQWDPMRAFKVAMGDVLTDEELDHFNGIKNTRRSAEEFVCEFIKNYG